MKNYISSGDWSELERSGKLAPKTFGTIDCYFCSNSVTTTAEDGRGIQLPSCRSCGIYYEPQWILEAGILAIRIMPRSHSAEHTDSGAMQQGGEPQQDDTENEKQGQAETSQKNAPQHKDVRGQILTLFYQENRPIQTGAFINKINASRQSITTTLNKLIAENIIRKTERATYQLIQKDNEDVS